MKLPYRGPDALSCVRHYSSSFQGGSGMYPVFSGSRYQRGSGVGDIFKGLWRTAVPFIKKGLYGIGRYALRSGGRLLDDLEQGTNLKTAAKARFDEAKRDAIGTVIGNQDGSGRKRKRKSHKRAVKRLKKKDIFG